MKIGIGKSLLKSVDTFQFWLMSDKSARRFFFFADVNMFSSLPKVPMFQRLLWLPLLPRFS